MLTEGGDGGRIRRVEDPNGERVQAAGCRPGDASAWAYLGPEVSGRAGRMPGSRSSVVLPGAGRIPEAGRAGCVPQARYPDAWLRPWRPFSASQRQREADGSTLGQDSGGLASGLFPSPPCGLTRNPVDSKLTLDTQ